MSPTHYETLGLAPEATPEEIRKARIRMIRLHPPEEHPEEFQRIDLAYRTLSDPVARSDYDARLTHGPELQRLNEEAMTLFEGEDWAGAARCFKKLVVLNPSSAGDWNMLGICLTRAKAWPDARKAYDRLVRLQDHSVLYWINFAVVPLSEADEHPEGSARQLELLGETRRILDRALALEPGNLDVHRMIAKTWRAQKDYSQEIAYLERVLAGSREAPDPDLYLTLAQALHLSGDTEGIIRTADRLREALPDDPNARRRGSLTFGKFAAELHDAHLFYFALPFLRAAARIDPQDETLRKFLDQCEAAEEASKAYERAKEDPAIIPPLRFFLALLSDEARNLELEEPRENYISKISEALNTYDGAEIVAAARRIRTAYPSLYRLQSDLFDKLEQPATPAQPSSPSPSSSSDCFVVTATFGGPHEPLVERYRSFRDDHLARTVLGRGLIVLYGRIGPPLAAVIRRRPRLRRGSAAILTRLSRWLPASRPST